MLENDQITDFAEKYDKLQVKYSLELHFTKIGGSLRLSQMLIVQYQIKGVEVSKYFL